MLDTVNAEIREIVVENTARLVEENYAFPDVATEMAARVRESLMNGHYDAVTTPSVLCRTLTSDLREISADLHLGMFYNPDEAAEILACQGKRSTDDEPSLEWWLHVDVDNFGFKRLEYLTGNIGYVDLRYFAPVSLGGDTATAAMRFLSNSDVLIFDLRDNGGGDPFMVQLLETFLFDVEPKLLLTLYNRPRDKLQQIWTLPHVPGNRMPDIPVYVLTSGRTFSGG